MAASIVLTLVMNSIVLKSTVTHRHNLNAQTVRVCHWRGVVTPKTIVVTHRTSQIVQRVNVIH